MMPQNWPHFDHLCKASNRLRTKTAHYSVRERKQDANPGSFGPIHDPAADMPHPRVNQQSKVSSSDPLPSTVRSHFESIRDFLLVRVVGGRGLYIEHCFRFRMLMTQFFPFQGHGAGLRGCIEKKNRSGSALKCEKSARCW